MKYYVLYKTSDVKRIESPIVFGDGYNFVKKISISLYDECMIDYILCKKFNESLKKIIGAYIQSMESDDASDGDREALLAKVELLRSILLGKYAFFMNKKTVENYLNKLEKLENKIGKMTVKKSRSL